MVNDFSKLLEFQKQSLAHGTFSYWVDEGESHPTLKQPKICSFPPPSHLEKFPPVDCPPTKLLFPPPKFNSPPLDNIFYVITQ